MTDFVTAQGLQIKTVEEILAELAARQKAEIDSTLNTAADSPVGQLNGIFASQLREAWEVIQVAYNGFNPDGAEGFLLEKLSALTGTTKRAASKSTVELSCDLDSGTALIAGTHFANVVGDPTSRWTPINDFTAGSDGVDLVQFEAEFAGAVIANAVTITDINTALTGWNSVSNVSDATVGREADTDTILRTRREEELRATGSATVDAIRADILQDPDVDQCNVFENVFDSVGANGLPPKSFEAIVFDGTPPALTNDQIAQLIWDTKPAGIRAFGLESGTAQDSLGFFHFIRFSRPTEREIWLELDLDINSSSGYAGADAVKSAIVLLNDTELLVGRDVIANAITCVAQEFAGVIDVSALRLGFSASPVGLTNLVIGPRELARLDTGRILIAENFIPIP